MFPLPQNPHDLIPSPTAMIQLLSSLTVRAGFPWRFYPVDGLLTASSPALAEVHSEPITESQELTPSRSQTDVERAVKTKQDVQEAERTKKRQNLVTRTLWTFIMIGGFMGEAGRPLLTSLNSDIGPGLLLMGHAYLIILVMLCQTLVYREVTALFSLKDLSPETTEFAVKGHKDPWSKTLNWYFFAVTNYFLYGESIIYYFKVSCTLLRRDLVLMLS
jgi:phosphatidate cytidylyltransferase